MTSPGEFLHLSTTAKAARDIAPAGGAARAPVRGTVPARPARAISRPHHGWAAAARLLPYLIAALSAGLCVLLLYPQIVAIPFQIVKNYNEGWNAYHALSAMAGDDLYPSPEALISNNYPPLSFYLIGFLSSLFGDPLIVGRIISVLSLLIVAANIALIINRDSGNWLLSGFFGLAFVAYAAALFTTYVGMNDPAWLGHAVMTTGFVIFFYRRDRAACLAAAAIVMITAGLIKHNLLPLPLAVTIWILIYEPRSLRIWMPTALIGTAIVLIFAAMVHGGDLFYGILGDERTYSLKKASDFFTRVHEYGLLIPGLIFLCITSILLLTTTCDDTFWLLILYAVISGIMTFALLPAAGIGQSALFDLVISAFCLVGICVARLASASSSAMTHALVSLVMIAVLLPVLVMAPNRLHAADWIGMLWQQEAETIADIDFIKSHSGIVACESLSLCYWAGKPFEMDFFIGGQRMRAEPIYQSRFIARLNAGEFALIQYMVPGRNRLPEEVEVAIETSYQVVRVSDKAIFYAPR